MMAESSSKPKDDDTEIVMEEYFDEGPDYCKLVQHYTLTYTALFIALVVYACIGAAVFRALESPAEYDRYRSEFSSYVDRRNDFVDLMWNVTASYADDEDAWRARALLILQNHEQKTGAFVMPPYRRKIQWSFAGALFFSCTVISTIGYGNIAPVTIGGRVFCMIYAVFGIAMLLLVLASIGSLFARGATLTYRLLNMNIQMARGAPPPKKEKKLRSVRVPAPGTEGAEAIPLKDSHPREDDETRPTMEDVIKDIWSDETDLKQGDMPPMRVVKLKEPEADEVHTAASSRNDTTAAREQSDEVEAGDDVDIPLTIVLLFALMYVCLLAGMLSIWEEQWNYFEAFYFSFVTLTTIGFGDLVPLHQKNLLGCTFFILLGMAIMSMCIALAQDIIMKKVAWISERVGVALIKAKPA